MTTFTKSISLINSAATNDYSYQTFITLNATNTSLSYLVAQGQVHQVGIKSISFMSSAAITGATTISLALYDQRGNKLLNNILKAPLAVPASANTVTPGDLGSHWMLPLASILGRISTDTASQLDLVVEFDAAVTNTSDVDFRVNIELITTNLGVIAGTGKTVAGDQNTPATN